MNAMSDQMTLWVINVLIHSTVLTASLLLVAAMFRRRAAMRYWILCCGLLLVLVSPAISALIQSRGSSWLALAAPSELATVPISLNPQAAEQTERNVAALAESLPAESSEVGHNPAMDSMPHRMSDLSPESEAPIAAVHPPKAPKPEPAEVTEPRSLMQWLTASVAMASLIWMAGAVMLLLRMSIGWFRLSRILKRAESIEGAGFQAAFKRACAAVGCGNRRTPRLVTSNEISGPLAAGVCGSYVVLPQNLVAKASPGELAEVLVHEVAHVVRRDPVVVLVQNLVSALYWPNPLVHRLNRELAKAREEVCDNFVLATTDAPVYSRTLLSLAQLVQRPETMPGSVGFFASRWKLENRIAGLLDEARDRTTFLGLRGWAFVGVSMLTLLTAISLGTLTIATAQNADQQAPAISNPKAIVINGIVRGPDGAPIAGARVIALENFLANTAWTTESEILDETTSDEAGRYSMSVRRDSDRFSDGMYLEEKHLSVLATLAGYGPDEQKVSVGGTPTDLKLATAERVISGQIVDLEGQPIEGVRVRLQEIRQPPSAMGRTELIDQWVTAAKDNPATFDMSSAMKPFSGGSSSPRRVAFYPEAERMRGIATLGIEARTDRDGRFELPAIGDDRLAILRVDGAGIASSMIRVVARDIPAVNTPGMEPTYRTGKTFGSRFQMIAEPSQILQGVITDRQSGKPISGATISLSQLPGNLRSIEGFLSTTSNDEGRYVLSGLPRNTKQSGGSLTVRVIPPSDQPYFRSTQSVPVRDELEPIPLDIRLTRGIWATGRVTESGSGEPVAGLVAYHPSIDNANAADHEAFDASITSMGYEEMFATDVDGTFRVPALRGDGILRAVAKNDDHYELAKVPGTRMEEPGRIRPGTRKIYHNIMPGNGVVALKVDDRASVVDTEIKLTRVPSLTIDVVNPDGTPATGFRVAGRRLTNRATLSGRGYRFWEEEPSQTSTIEVMLGDDRERDRPMIVLDKSRNLGAVVWLSSVDAFESKLTVRLQPNARIIGNLVGGSDDPFARAFLHAGLGDARELNVMFQFSGGARIKVSKDLPFQVSSTSNVAEDGRFELTIPASDRCTVLLKNFPGDPLLLDNKAIPPGGVLDLGTIDLSAEPKTWPKPKLSQRLSSEVGAIDANLIDAKQVERVEARRQQPLLAGRVSDPDGNPISAQVWIAGPPRSAGWKANPMPVKWFKVTRSDERGKFQIPKSILDKFSETNTQRSLLVRVAATSPGRGFAWADIAIGQPNENVVLELVQDVIVRGKIVSTEGKPIAGVEISVVDVAQPEALPDSATLIESGSAGSGVYTNWPEWMGGPPTSETVATDSKGRFAIGGMGGERYLRLQARGDSIADTRLSIVTRRPPADRKSGMIGTRKGRAESKYFADFTHVAVPGRSLRGQVTDAGSGVPLAGVKVVAPTAWRSRMKPTFTDDSGHFVIDGIPKAEQYTLELTPEGVPGYFRKEVVIRDVPSETDLLANVDLAKGKLLTGRIVDSKTGQGLEGSIEYNALYPNPNVDEMGSQQVANPLAVTQSNEDGTFSIAILPGLGAVGVRTNDDSYCKAFVEPSDVEQHFRDVAIEARPNASGRYTNFPTANGGQSRGLMGVIHFNAFKLLKISASEALDPLQIEINRSVERSGEIFDTAGQPLEDVEVIGLGPSQASGTESPLRSNTFSVLGLHPSESRTLIFYHREKALGASVVIRGSERDSIRVTLRPTGSIVGKIIDSEGKPVSGLEIEDLGLSEIGLTGTYFWLPEYRKDGTFKCDGLIEGVAYDLRARTPAKPYSMPVLSDIQASPGEVTDIGTFTVTENGRFETLAKTSSMRPADRTDPRTIVDRRDD